MNAANLLYRRQFILGDHPITKLPGWQVIKFGSYYVNVHPDLESTISKKGDREFLLLGFILSHLWPEANNQELMDEMARTCQTFDEMLDYCQDLCGRYVILFRLPPKTGLIHDLIGSRTVYWCIHQNELWCASQPSTLSAYLDIKEDLSPIVREYIDKYINANGEARWIGDGSIYLGIKHLLPNHYLDFEEKRSIRYWPRHPRGDLSIENAAHAGAEILEKTMQAASNRFTLSMAITSGWDSRTLLSATRKVSSKIYFYIQKFGGMTDSHPDIQTPLKLTRKIGIPFRVIDCAEYQDDSFDDTLTRNVFLLHNPDKKVLYRNFYHSFNGKVNMAGNISDLGRNFYGSQHVDKFGDLLELLHLSGCNYAMKALNQWYVDAMRHCDASGYNLLDLYFWEQELGNWGSMFASELDIAIDEFYPFGTRRLIETILAVDEKSRPYTNSRVHRRIIQLLWSELLSEPINPIGWRVKAIRWLQGDGKEILSRTGLLPLIKKFLPRFRLQ